MKWTLTNRKKPQILIQEQKQWNPVRVVPQSAPAPKTTPQYNPHAPNTAATTYKGGCGGGGKVPR